MSRHHAPRFVATATGNEGGPSYRYGAERSSARLQFDTAHGDHPAVEIHGRIEGSTPWVRVVACQNGRYRVLYDGPMDRILDGEDVQPRETVTLVDFYGRTEQIVERGSAQEYVYREKGWHEPGQPWIDPQELFPGGMPCASY